MFWRAEQPASLIMPGGSRAPLRRVAPAVHKIYSTTQRSEASGVITCPDPILAGKLRCFAVMCGRASWAVKPLSMTTGVASSKLT
jgi:hypothetical protein